jgi:predicted Zn finger-like uncharacterized protein
MRGPSHVNNSAFTALSRHRQSHQGRKNKVTGPIGRLGHGGHGFQSINGRLLGFGIEITADAMLIVCPSCATSYLIDPASVGPAGRAVRCARCKKTWFAGAPETAPNVTSFVDNVIAEAQAQSAGAHSSESPSRIDEPAKADDRSGDLSEPPPATPIADIASPPIEPPNHNAQNNLPEPVTITDAPPLAPSVEHGKLQVATNAEFDTEEAETFAARRLRLKTWRRESRRSQKWIATFLVLAAVNVTLVLGRAEVVRDLPQTASLFAWIGLPVNLRDLQFENVHITKDDQDGVQNMLVEGTIVSIGAKPVEVPRLRFAARNASGQEIYTWTALPSRSILGPSESLTFSSRLVSPPPEASDVIVRFFNSRDAAAGAK